MAGQTICSMKPIALAMISMPPAAAIIMRHPPGTIMQESLFNGGNRSSEVPCSKVRQFFCLALEKNSFGNPRTPELPNSRTIELPHFRTPELPNARTPELSNFQITYICRGVGFLVSYRELKGNPVKIGSYPRSCKISRSRKAVSTLQNHCSIIEWEGTLAVISSQKTCHHH